MSKTCKIFYNLNEEGRKKSLLSNGDGNQLQCIEAPLTKEILNIKTVTVDLNGNVELKINEYLPIEAVLKEDYGCIRINDKYYYKPYIGYNSKYIYFDHVLTAEEAINWEKSRLENLNKLEEALQEKYQERLNNYNKKLEEYEKIEELDKINKAKQKELDRINREKEKEDDINWIKEHGSERLKLCSDMEYECKRLYIQERTTKDFPEFELDFDDNADWQDRVSPSLNALKEAKSWIDKGFNCKVVWLTSPVHRSEYDYENDFERCEALILKFKGYWLVKEM